MQKDLLDSSLHEVTQVTMSVGSMGTVPERIQTNVTTLLAQRFGEEINEALKNGNTELSISLSKAHRNIRLGLNLP